MGDQDKIGQGVSDKGLRASCLRPGCSYFSNELKAGRSRQAGREAHGQSELEGSWSTHLDSVFSVHR